MKSHEFQFNWRELLGSVAPTLAVVLLAASLVLAARQSHLLPASAMTLYPDLTMLAHQARASRQPDLAEILLLGDSTCLMGVDARQLSGALPGRPPTLSLALIVGLDLNVYGHVLADFAAANPGRPRVAVLLLSPGKLASPARDAGETEVWEQLERLPSQLGESQPSVHNVGESVKAMLRNNLLSHALDTPLHGNGAEHFGFASQIDRHLTLHRGSLLDFGAYIAPRRGKPMEFKLSPAFETESRAFRSLVPAGTRLFVGLTPVARSQTIRADQIRRDELLRQWNQWIQADVLLTNLPTALPDGCFSTSGHLNGDGQSQFTELLAAELARLTPKP